MKLGAFGASMWQLHVSFRRMHLRSENLKPTHISLLTSKLCACLLNNLSQMKRKREGIASLVVLEKTCPQGTTSQKACLGKGL
jgi:hypothetical protein